MSTHTLRLILWPTVITALIGTARLVGEVRGWVTTRSGGAQTPLGITSCVFAFGGWFGFRVPFTIVGGTFAGLLLARFGRRR